MKYLPVGEARKLRGLRLVLSAHVPGPWGESAKAIFNARNVGFIPVEQTPFGENAELCEWTGGIRNAPIAMLDDEPPVHGWLDLVNMVERLGSGASLIPESSIDRALALGLSAELCAPWGFGWARRLLIFERTFGLGESLKSLPPHIAAMLQQYGFSEEAVEAARLRTVDILSTLAAQLAKQEAAGSSYFVGNRPSTIDYHWACFSQMIAPLKVEHQPNMPASLIEKYADIDEVVDNALHPSLIAHRDMIFHEHIGLPLDF